MTNYIAAVAESLNKGDGVVGTGSHLLPTTSPLVEYSGKWVEAVAAHLDGEEDETSNTIDELLATLHKIVLAYGKHKRKIVTGRVDQARMWACKLLRRWALVDAGWKPGKTMRNYDSVGIIGPTSVFFSE